MKLNKKIKKINTSLAKNEFKNIINEKNLNIDNYNKYTEYEGDRISSIIKSKSLAKIKPLNKNHVKKYISIKLPSLKKNNISNNNLKESKNKKPIQQIIKEKHSGKKLKINTNSITNLYSRNKNNNNTLLNKHSGSTFNLNMSQNLKKINNRNLNTQSNAGLIRHLDRKKIKANKSIILPKHGYKLFTTTKIINNFNNQINQNRNKEIYTISENSNNNNQNTNNKKHNVLVEMEDKYSKINNCFGKNLEEEENITEEKILNNSHKNENNDNDNIVEIISDISLSEEELDFSKDDSLDDIDFSLDEDEI